MPGGVRYIFSSEAEKSQQTTIAPNTKTCTEPQTNPSSQSREPAADRNTETNYKTSPRKDTSFPGAAHISGVDNRLPDHLSRWHLSPVHAERFNSLTQNVPKVELPVFPEDFLLDSPRDRDRPRKHARQRDLRRLRGAARTTKRAAFTEATDAPFELPRPFHLIISVTA
ncbi:hypothetical protein Bbelb_111600 [Branchiostoma belcheri]|nr:hypothetical protein Bbelb_111600 [Branchiostoma belcheri]